MGDLPDRAQEIPDLALVEICHVLRARRTRDQAYAIVCFDDDIAEACMTQDDVFQGALGP